ncbi:MAG: DUF3368 domain-containing protein [Thiotrichaceae bacterium]
MRKVISDASPLIALSIVDGLNWLPQLFDEVWVPEQVRAEVLSDKQVRGEAEIQQAIHKNWLKIWDKPITSLINLDLDEGESACINLALANPEPVLLIIDEKAGRAVAQEKGIQIVGTAAIIGMAKNKGFIPSARDVFEVLHTSDFRISGNVIKTILTRVGEFE